jgi:hypothetical protein
MNHPLRHRRKIKAPVETVIEGSQVVVGVLIESEGMKSATETGFQIAQNRIDPAEFRQFFGVTPPHDYWLMKATDLRHSTEAGQTVRDHFTPYRQ